MKYLSLAIVSVSLLTACGGAGDSSDSSGVERFNPAPYIAASEQLNGSGYAGSWVGVVNIRRERTNMVNVEISKIAESSRLESLIIRNKSAEAGGGWEMANCAGGFDPMNITIGKIVTEHGDTGREFLIETTRHLTYKASGFRTVGLSPVSYYQENVTVELDFYKVSDDADSLGSVSLNWSDTEGDSTSAIHCALIENKTGGYRTVALSHENDLQLYVAEAVIPPSVEAYVGQNGHTGEIVNRFTLGEQNVQFSEEGPDVWRYNYSVTASNGLGASGQVVLDLLP
ncbi:hypothetical protein HUF18_04855 [Thalassolituus sp. ST750PaO-4]|uniref:hypothetical protein n=1 Tax=Thalassolituus sp. ST750PaO-4 TaxID=2742965 RepID=UPI001CE25BC8|nr:hypothetical protein [Thalassolituus sp. ST750PaO-4]MCA6059097.1 hypothetical protein [Thalassolituus sp. ST750PaO-4]